MRKLKLLFFLLSFSSVESYSQQADSIKLLKEVEIQETRISAFSSGLKIEKIDTLTLQQRPTANIATLLSEQTFLFLRSYSPGGVATLSLRGTNSSQSAVMWNGINISQPNLGMTDLSRMSVLEFNDITIYHGGNSALLGSGAIGGGITLDNELKYASPTKVSMMLNAGSTSKLGGAARWQIGKNQLAYSGSLVAENNENSFSYIDLFGKKTTLRHARVASISSVHQAQIKLSKKQQLSVGLWYQNTNRELPGSMTMSSSDQQQWDEVLRSTLKWNYTASVVYHSVRLAYIDEKENYKSPVAQIDAWYKLKTVLAESENKILLNSSVTLGYGLSYKLIRADIDSYQTLKTQQEGILWISSIYNHSKSGFKGVLNLRQDFVKDYKVPFCPAINAEIPFLDNFKVRMAVSRNFRIPTMNDKYWIPGGNPELKPENSWNQDAGVSWEKVLNEKWSTQLSLNTYFLVIDNLIQWVPGGSGTWSPQNVSQVFSRGIEISLKSNLRAKSTTGTLKVAYSYSPSTLSKVSASQVPNLNNQMIYIPLHKAVATISISRKVFYYSASYNFTGLRYVTTDNKQYLPSFMLCDVYAGANLLLKQWLFKIQLDVRNLFNYEFQSVMYYPEPGRTFNLSLIFNH